MVIPNPRHASPWGKGSVMRNLFVVFIVLPLLCMAMPAFAADEKIKTYKVGIIDSAPFVIDSGSGKYSGLAFELWGMISGRLGIKSEYVLYPSFKELLQGAKDGVVDVIVTGIVVNHERLQYLQFSFPWHEGGLRILVNSEVRKNSTWDILRQRGHLGVYRWIVLLIIVLAIGQALLRRRRDDEFPRTWLEGLSLSLNEIVRSAKSGTPQKNVLGWVGYMFMTIWMLFGFGLLAYITSTVTSAMTAATMGVYSHVDINSLNDLPGKRVGVLSQTVSEKYMRAVGSSRLYVYDTYEEALNALMKKEVDALVKEAAELEYMVHNNPRMHVMVVGNTFSPLRYAFAANKKHEKLIGAISEEVIRLLDNGTVENLKNTYLGNTRF